MQESCPLDESEHPTSGASRCRDSQQQSQQQWQQQSVAGQEPQNERPWTLEFAQQQQWQQQSVAGQEPQNERPWTLEFARELSDMIYPYLAAHLNAHIGAQLEELRALVVQMQSVTEHEPQTRRSEDFRPLKRTKHADIFSHLAIEQDGKIHRETQEQKQAGLSDLQQRLTPTSLRNDASGSNCCRPSFGETFTRMSDIEAAVFKHLEEDVLSMHCMPSPVYDSEKSDTHIDKDRPQAGDAKYPAVGDAANYPTVERKPLAALVGKPNDESADEEAARDNLWNSEQSTCSRPAFPLWGSLSKTRCRGTFQMLESLRKLQGNEVHKMRAVRDAQITSSISADLESVMPTLVEFQSSDGSNDNGTGLGGYLVEQFIWNEAFCGRYLTMIITLLALTSCILEHVFATPYSRSTCEVLGDGLLHLGALGGLLALRRVSVPNLLRGSDSFLVSYARRHKVIKLWRVTASRFRKAKVVLWIMGVLSRVAAHVHEAATNAHVEDADWYIRWVACLGYMWSLGVFMANVYSIVHACSVLAILVDNYSCITVALATLEAGVREWNLLQAVLRKVSVCVEIAFVVLQTITILYIALAVAALLIYGMPAYWLSLSALLVTVCNATMFMSAAQVTERVNRVPPLLNSLSCGDRQLDNSRHHLVEYVMYSAAGFYVFEVRLTASTALKVTYISGMVVFGILTKLTASF